MSVSKTLSICIPTYNREKLLSEALKSIIVQLSPEICKQIDVNISDNASSDATINMLKQFKNEYPELSLNYKVNERNLGPDQNFINAMNMGQGEFIWMMGSDDTLLADSIINILNIINSREQFGILLFNRIDCNYDLSKKTKRYWLNETIKVQLFDFSDKFQEGSYYSQAKDTGALFSYISSFVSKREMLTLFKFDKSYIGTSYSFLFYIFSYLKSGINVLYVSNHYVYCRLENSSFHNTLPKRLKIDFNGFIKIRNDFFKGDDINAASFLYILKKTHKFHKILALYSSADKKDWSDYFKPTLKLCGWSDMELTAIEKLGSSPNLYQSKMKQSLKKVFITFTKAIHEIRNS